MPFALEQNADPVIKTLTEISTHLPIKEKKILDPALQQAINECKSQPGLILEIELKKKLLGTTLEKIANQYAALINELKKNQENNQKTEELINAISKKILSLHNSNSTKTFIEISRIFNKETLASIKNQETPQQEQLQRQQEALEQQEQQRWQQEALARQQEQQEQQEALARQQEQQHQQQEQQRQQQQQQEQQRQQEQQEALARQQEQQHQQQEQIRQETKETELLQAKIQKTVVDIESHLASQNYSEIERLSFLYSYKLKGLPIKYHPSILLKSLLKHSESFRKAHQKNPTENQEFQLLSLYKTTVDILKEAHKSSAEIIQKKARQYLKVRSTQRQLHQTNFLPAKTELFELMQQKQAATKIQAAMRRHSAQKSLQQRKDQKNRKVLTIAGTSSAASGGTAGAIIAVSTHLSFIPILHIPAALAIAASSIAGAIILPIIPLAIIATWILYKKKYSRPPTQTILAICDRQPEPPACNLNP